MTPKVHLHRYRCVYLTQECICIHEKTFIGGAWCDTVNSILKGVLLRLQGSSGSRARACLKRTKDKKTGRGSGGRHGDTAVSMCSEFG